MSTQLTSVVIGTMVLSLALGWQPGSGRPDLAWCADAGKRFPAWQTPTSAISQFADPHFVEADKVVAGWILVSLYHAHFRYEVPRFGEEPPTLEEHVTLQTGWRFFLGTRPPASRAQLPDMYTLLTPEQANKVMALPQDSCDGALLSAPQNTVLLQLMKANAGDRVPAIWRPGAAAPTPTPGSRMPPGA